MLLFQFKSDSINCLYKRESIEGLTPSQGVTNLTVKWSFSVTTYYGKKTLYPSQSQKFSLHLTDNCMTVL